ncbi:MAG: beta-ketoacyl-[acyl-carrier-protein] synthase family protein, partial [Vulcanimicrobiaceae bacterium]
ARIYGEIAGFGLTGDAYHMTSPLPEGTSAARAMTDALREARVAPEEVELYNAHGSSSQLNDVTETRSMKRAFGAAAAGIPVSATKGQTGHALGASGAWETAVTLLAMHQRRVPRIVNLENVDPACDLDFVREERALAPRVVLKNSTGFGGINAALVLRSAEAR